MSTERFPAFFDQVPRLVVRDPLADFLGAAEGGVLDYGYADAVRMAGHSCPTVASAYAARDVGHALDGFGCLVPRKEGRRVLGVLFVESGSVAATVPMRNGEAPEVFSIGDEAVTGGWGGQIHGAYRLVTKSDVTGLAVDIRSLAAITERRSAIRAVLLDPSTMRTRSRASPSQTVSAICRR